jgi:hypothetical protein
MALTLILSTTSACGNETERMLLLGIGATSSICGGLGLITDVETIAHCSDKIALLQSLTKLLDKELTLELLASKEGFELAKQLEKTDLFLEILRDNKSLKQIQRERLCAVGFTVLDLLFIAWGIYIIVKNVQQANVPTNEKFPGKGHKIGRAGCFEKILLYFKSTYGKN